MSDADRLQQLLDAGRSCITIVTCEEAEALQTVRDAAESLIRPFYVWSLGYGLRDGRQEDAPAEPNTDTAAPALSHVTAGEADGIYAFLDIADNLGNEVAWRMLRDAIRQVNRRGGALVLIDPVNNYPEVVKAYAVEFALSLPGEEELDRLVRSTLRKVHWKHHLEVGITRRGLRAIVRNLRRLTRRQARNTILETVATDRRLTTRT